MPWEAIAAIGQILGALAVFITLVYLANQVRHSNEVARFGAVRDIMNQYNDVNKLLTTDATLRAALMKEADLSADEEEQVYNFATMFCNIWQSIQMAHDEGQVDDGWLAAGIVDARHEIDRWPNFRPAVERWMATYPTNSDTAIFNALKESTHQPPRKN